MAMHPKGFIFYWLLAKTLHRVTEFLHSVVLALDRSLLLETWPTTARLLERGHQCLHLLLRQIQSTQNFRSTNKPLGPRVLIFTLIFLRGSKDVLLLAARRSRKTCDLRGSMVHELVGEICLSSSLRQAESDKLCSKTVYCQ